MDAEAEKKAFKDDTGRLTESLKSRGKKPARRAPVKARETAMAKAILKRHAQR